MSSPALSRFAYWSIAAALATITLKTAAWWLTGSVGLLSDALESGVNLASALVALMMLAIAARPPSDRHAFGHGKAEYFSSGFEGLLIIFAAIAIGVAAIERLMHPQLLTQAGIGLVVSVFAALINFLMARVLLSAGRTYQSITLEASAQHLMTDVWSTLLVLVGVGVVALTGWVWLDAVLALLVAVHIVLTGWQLIRRSTAGLMDAALPVEQQEALRAVLVRYQREQGIDFHALRTRQAGPRNFVAVHVLVPGAWTVQRGHDLLEVLEADLRQAVPHLAVLTHLEPLEDPASAADIALDRALDRPFSA